VSKVNVINGEILPAYIDGKSPRLDVNVTFNDGELADLEMQMKRTEDDLKERSSQYLSMLHAGQVKKGKEYNDTKRVYQIFFLNFNLFPGSHKVPRRYGFREESEHDLLSDKTEIIFYEMPKLEQKVKDYFDGKAGIENLSEDEKWCIYFKYRHEREIKPLISELCRREEGIMKAENEVVKVSRSFKRYIRQMSKMKDEIDLRYKLRAARREGIVEIARNLLAKGSTSEFVSEITGLSLEEIADL